VAELGARASESSGAGSPPELVTTAGTLAEVVRELAAAPRYAIDTEFHRERTYWPRLALVQVAWEPGPRQPVRIALIDPLAVDPAPLDKVLGGSGVMVAHAASQDLEVLSRACNALPTRLFDTQVGAGFLGYGSASLASLVDRFVHLHLAKGDRLTDWSRRPLTSSQLSYAAADVAHLFAVADVISEKLSERGRLSWAEEECATLLERPLGSSDPQEAWWKLRDNRQFQGVSRAIAQEVAAWREQKARSLDIQPRMVLPDLALLSIAHSPPADAGALRETRGIDPRHLRSGIADEIMAAIARGRELTGAQLRIAHSDLVAKELRPAVALGSAWVAQLSRDEDVDAALLATRSDIVDFLSGKRGARLGEGWRAQLVGAPLHRLASGEASLALDGHGRLLLEDRPAPSR